MKRLLIIVFVVLGVGWAQTYEPSWQTRQEVAEAASFTDGFAFTCGEYATAYAEGAETTDFYMVCVDASNTYWSPEELSDWSDYGLTLWETVEPWTRNERGMLSTIIVRLDRNEMLSIVVMGQQVFYIVMPL